MCNCTYCKLSRRIQKHFPKKSLSPEQRKVLNDLWTEMEGAGLGLSVMQAKADGSWPSDEMDFRNDETCAILAMI